MTIDVDQGSSTFGAPLSLADDLLLSDEIGSATTPHSLASVREVREGLEADQRPALAGRRWKENDDGFLIHDADELIPGDVVAIRHSAVVQLMRSIEGFAENAPNRNLAMERLEVTSRLVYNATPAEHARVRVAIRVDWSGKEATSSVRVPNNLQDSVGRMSRSLDRAPLHQI